MTTTRKATTMPTADPMPTREQLEQQAAELSAKLDVLRQQQDQREQQERQRRAQAEHEYDQQAVAAFSRAQLDNEVAQARAQFDAAVAGTPLVQALADYLYALQRRRTATYENGSARTRLGLPAPAGHDLPRAELGAVEDIIAAAVRHLVTARTDADAAALAAKREVAITAATETQEPR